MSVITKWFTKFTLVIESGRGEDIKVQKQLKATLSPDIYSKIKVAQFRKEIEVHDDLDRHQQDTYDRIVGDLNQMALTNDQKEILIGFLDEMVDSFIDGRFDNAED